MSTWTSTREGVTQALQKANDSYAMARRFEERVRGLEDEQARLRRQVAMLEDTIHRLTAVESPKPRRKAA